MSDNSFKSQATRGMLWSAIDKFAIQGMQFIVGIILARLLTPADFGLIGMLSIFIAVSQSLVDSGMGAGLIQKKSRIDSDYSTVFIFNFGISLLLFCLLYFLAPFIADFYELPQLTLLTRVLASSIIINALAIVQLSKLMILIDFKTIAKVNAVAALLSGVIAVWLAYIGWGVWALVFQIVFKSIVSVAFFWFYSSWKVSFIFSRKSFKELFGFGSWLLIAGVKTQIINNTYNIVIGKFYSASELGFYTRAKSFSEIISSTVTSVLQQVSYPLLASIQDDRSRMVSVYRRLIKMTAFLIFPAMTMLALLADPLVRLLLTEKWLPVVVLLQWLCFARIITPISVVNMNILNAIGRSDLFLKVDISKTPLTIIALLITLPIGLEAMVIGQVITSIISFFINAYMPGKLFGYGSLSQLKDMIPFIFATIMMSIFVVGISLLISNLYLKILIPAIVGSFVYYFVCKIARVEELNEIKLLLHRNKK